MNIARSTRRLTLCVAALALAQHGLQAQAYPTARPAKPSMAAHDRDGKPNELRDGMRRLWTDHVAYTRLYIISATQRLPDTDATAKRLLKNQDDIGAAIKPYYGAEAGDRLAGLLKEHITIATEIVDAAMMNDEAKKDAASKRWGTNADRLATFLSGANPNWPKADLRKMLDQHLELTAEELDAQLKKDWDRGIATYDRINDQILGMADALTDGIMKQHPGKMK